MAEVVLNPYPYPISAVITELGTPRVLWQKVLLEPRDFDPPDRIFYCPFDILMLCRHGHIVDWLRQYPDGAVVDLLSGVMHV